MKKTFFFLVTLCITHIAFTQINVDNAGNVGIGGTPNSKAKLLLKNSKAATDTLFGLHSTVENSNGNLNNPLYGAYFKNRLMNGSNPGSAPFYGIFIDNQNTKYANSTYGVYTNNNVSGYSSSTYGYYVNNIAGNGGYSGSIYGLYANNTSTFSYGSTVYGAYLSSTGATGTNHPENHSVYGIYSTVSGGASAKRYSGYFTGGKFVVMNGSVGIGKEPTGGLLDVAGNIAVNGSVVISSDERLKTAIKPLSDEKEKLYLLQGKSYKKVLPPIEEEKDSLSATGKAQEKEVVEFSEYGYLAQELKEIFPDLVNQDSAGYYSVNYIGLIPVIIEALKDQRSEIEEKQIRIEKQQIQMDEQREQIKQLVKLMGIKSIDKKAFEENGIESIPMLLQNTPNPFNRATEIGYFIPETVGSANIYIYDVNGIQQRNISISERGSGVTVLQATALQAGIYFYTLICDGKPVDTKQMILTR
ncbi:MAG: tail fiber domain-containing protein [Prevotellaceae bacterium]|jgi:hypothetical protein|nr:tail fiber domain-containing protein [Prevotellaceae bacterium]